MTSPSCDLRIAIEPECVANVRHANALVGQPRLVIVTNGLKDCRGHHYETAIAVAEAAAEARLTPILAPHVDCRADLVPSWLTSVPTFRTEYWSAATGPRARVRTALDKALPRLPACAAEAVGWALDQRARWRRLTADRREAASATKAAAKIASDEASIEVFRSDLRRLLTQLKVGAADHVYLPTTHGRELVAVRRLLDELSATDCPTFHLEFRNPLFLGARAPDDAASSGDAEPWPLVAHEHQLWFQLYRELGVSDRVLLYTDAEPLSREYERVAQLPLAVLPVPFRSRLLQPQTRDVGTPLRLTYLGEPRDDKGFHWLPALMQQLWGDDACRGRVELHCQASMASPSVNPRSIAARRRLERYPRDWVRWYGQTGPLSAEAYYELLTQADIVLFPYEPARYQTATSGTFAEALAAGKPTVVPAGTWLASQQPAGSGEVFVDRQSFVDCVYKVIAGYDTYRQRAAAFAPQFLAWHTPSRLVEQLIQGSPAPRRQAS